MSDIAIQVQGLGKRYALGGSRKPYKTLRESVVDAVRAPFQKRDKSPNSASSFWALKDVNFSVNRGEVVGIIGRNGAGKSTLLKILSRITEPTEGAIDITGRVGSLLEVGTGFHPELTGRENIYLNGAILGMRRGEIEGKFDEIVAFAETEKFLDTPVKYYSSGMYTRLAFAVAAHLEPEILIVDEVLAVGDAEFQKKCMGKMNDVAHEGRTVLFVSHNLPAIENLCHRGVLLSNGRVVEIGETSKVLARYRSMAEGRSVGSLAARTDRSGTGRARAERIELLDLEGQPIASCTPGVPFRFRLHGTAFVPIPRLEVSIDVDTNDGGRVTTMFSGFQGVGFPVNNAGPFVLECLVENFTLRPATYALNAWLGSGLEVFDFINDVDAITVEPIDFYGGGRMPEPGHGPYMANFKWQILNPR